LPGAGLVLAASSWCRQAVLPDGLLDPAVPAVPEALAAGEALAQAVADSVAQEGQAVAGALWKPAVEEGLVVAAGSLSVSDSVGPEDPPRLRERNHPSTESGRANSQPASWGVTIEQRPVRISWPPL